MMDPAYFSPRFLLLSVCAPSALFALTGEAAGIPVYSPEVSIGYVYEDTGVEGEPRYSHAPDVVRFQGTYLAVWMGNPNGSEGKPGQALYLSTSTDFTIWSPPQTLFSDIYGWAVPWQPALVNVHDEDLYCAWSMPSEGRLVVSRTTDGKTWTHQDVPAAPGAVQDRLTGFPTGHGLVTSKGRILIPCSLPPVSKKGLWIRNRLQAVLISDDNGTSWYWSEPIAGAQWSGHGGDPAQHGDDDQIYHWELSLYEQADGTLRFLARNTSRMPDPGREDYRTLLTGESRDGGLSWTEAVPVEIDSLSARPFAAKASPSEGLLAVANDWVRSVPQSSWNTRFGLSLFLSPVDDPNLLLPGPLVQPENGLACYPDGIVSGDALYLVYTQGRGEHGYANIGATRVEPLPDFTRPFLLPRGARQGLTLDDTLARFSLPESSLALVLPPELTAKEKLTLQFETRLDALARNMSILEVGGKTRAGVRLRVSMDPTTGQPRYEAARAGDNAWQLIGHASEGDWNPFTVTLENHGVTLQLNDNPPVRLPGPVLRKISFGGLSEAPAWPRPRKSGNPAWSLSLSSIAVN
ncbi:MAG: sialidase family protein [Verrucomicrobiota bacterium JB024]|nr:sialidase family protein [Verrucomicrobiota bacterium JB024]